MYLDSDQMIYPNTIERSMSSIHDYDMLCLEEDSHKPQSFLQKLIEADRHLVNRSFYPNIDPLKGVLIPRLYRYALLHIAFNKIPINILHDIIFFDDSIVYYEAYSISSKVGLVPRAMVHTDIPSIINFCLSFLFSLPN